MFRSSPDHPQEITGNKHIYNVDGLSNELNVFMP